MGLNRGRNLAHLATGEGKWLGWGLTMGIARLVELVGRPRARSLEALCWPRLGALERDLGLANEAAQVALRSDRSEERRGGKECRL